MGGVTFFLFLVETVTGVLLMFYYRPTLEWAYQDMQALRAVTSLGILRELHRWGAHAMVITVWLHMYRVFLTGSYKPPREFNWVVGVILLLLTLLLSFTGYLLPWDQLGDLGHHGRLEHGPGHAVAGSRRAAASTAQHWRHRYDHQRLRCSLCAVGCAQRGRRDVESILRVALRRDSAGGVAVAGDPFLAGAERRRHQRAVVASDSLVAGTLSSTACSVADMDVSDAPIRSTLQQSIAGGLGVFYLLLAAMNGVAALLSLAKAESAAGGARLDGRRAGVRDHGSAGDERRSALGAAAALLAQRIEHAAERQERGRGL